MEHYRSLIEDLVHAGLLRVGDTLEAAKKMDLQAEVLEGGKLLLNRWPQPLSIRAATDKAHEIQIWGLVPFIPKLRRQNPLTYWRYLDPVTNTTEHLARLHELYRASYADPDDPCPICLEGINWGNTTEPRGDAFALILNGAEGCVVAPRRHFTSLESMPKRDEKAVNELLHTEISKSLSLGQGVQVHRESHQTGHVYYRIESTPTASAAS